MKKTLIAIASLSTLIGANAAGVSSSSEVIEGGNAILVDKRTRIKIYPEISVANSLRGTGINIVEQPLNGVSTTNVIDVTEEAQIKTVSSEEIPTEEAMQPISDDNINIVKRTGEFTFEPAVSGYTSTKTEKVYTKTFLGIPYAPKNVVVETSKPIHFGKLKFNNLTCPTGFNNGSIDVYGNESSSIIPVVFCPNGKNAQIELKIFNSPIDRNILNVEIGGQKVKVEKGYTSLYNLRYDDHNVINMEFIFEQDENHNRL